MISPQALSPISLSFSDLVWINAQSLKGWRIYLLKEQLANYFSFDSVQYIKEGLNVVM